VLGLHNYMVEKAQIPGEHQWWIIEYLPSENIAFSIRYPLRSTDWSIKCDLSEIFSSPRYINDLGQIFAFEYLFDVWDCKMKHILLDNDAKRLFRIDWEFIFGDTKYYGKSTTSDEGNMFLEEVSSRGGADMWIDKLQAAFLVSFKQARDQWGQLQAILIEAGISEEKIMKAAARLQRDPIQVLKERFPSIFTKSS